MKFIDLQKQYMTLKIQIDAEIQKVLEKADFISGEQTKILEEQLAEYVGINYCLTCANGTDALTLAFRALDINKNDIVFLPTFTFFATAEAPSLLGAEVVFVDIDQKTFNIDTKHLEDLICQSIRNGKNPKVILTVDLFGLPCDYETIQAIADKYNMTIVEDAAQGFGGSINGKMAGSFGHISTTSFFPAKPLGCYGDGGAIFTENKEWYDFLKSIAVHGKGKDKYDNVRLGYNSRLDTIQAAILLPKLKAFKEYELENRNKIADYYNKGLSDVVTTPFIPQGYISSYAQYTIKLKTEKDRNSLMEHLEKNGVPSNIYYSKCVHQQTAYKNQNINICQTAEKVCSQVLSLPMHPYLQEKELDYIIEKIKEYFFK